MSLSALSAPARYAIMALVQLGEDGAYHQAKALSDRTGIPGPYLAKVLQSLAEAGILESLRGPHGGFRLRRPAHRINLREVVVAMEGEGLPGPCPLGLDPCGGGEACALRATWEGLVGKLRGFFEDTTIRDLQLARIDLDRALGLEGGRAELKRIDQSEK